MEYSKADESLDNSVKDFAVALARGRGAEDAAAEDGTVKRLGLPRGGVF